jgi:hypothetical protein
MGCTARCTSHDVVGLTVHSFAGFGSASSLSYVAHPSDPPSSPSQGDALIIPSITKFVVADHPRQPITSNSMPPPLRWHHPLLRQAPPLPLWPGRANRGSRGRPPALAVAGKIYRDEKSLFLLCAVGAPH